MAIEFEDGSRLSTEDWDRIMNVVRQRAKENKPKPVKIQQSNVTVNVKGFAPKDYGGKAVDREHANYIEHKHKGWKIRVWTSKEKDVYCCNYFKGEDVRYAEVIMTDVRDENGVFKYVQSIINDIEE